MSENHPPPDQPPPIASAVPPLTHRSADGELYTRRPDVEAEIAEAVSRQPEEWAPSTLESETLVHLIRRLWPGEEKTVIGRLLTVLSKRITRIATASVRGFSPTITEEIVGAVGIKVIEVVVSAEVTAQTEFLECSFELAVQRRAFNQAEKRKRLRRTCSFPIHVSGDGEPGVDGSQMVPDDGPSPEELAAEAEFRAQAPVLVPRALAAIIDDDHREAVVLHHLQGWPITDKDPTRQTVTSHFGVTDRTIRNWMRTAFSEMRNALGVSHEQ